MKRAMLIFTIILIGCLTIPVQGFAGGKMSNEQIMQEINALRDRITALENQIRVKDRVISELKAHEAEKSSVGVKGLGDRVRRIEEQMEEGKKADRVGEWANRIHLSGAVEVEAGCEEMDFSDPALDDMDASDIRLATVELGVDVDIAKHVQGHVVLLWEEDDTEPVDVDEGFIILDGEDVLPLYLNAGKMYVPFGYYESHFVSDPLTLEIGETNETAVKAGFANDWVDLCAAVYNGDVNELDDGDDPIDGFAGSAVFTLPEGLVPDLGLMGGASYLSNIAESDGLEGETPGVLQNDVGGFGAFLSVSYLDRVFFEAEYVKALNSFEAGELSFDNGRRAEPRAWNLEMAFAPMERLELGVKYEGSEDMNDFLPEKQYGAVASYALFKYTTLSLEYLHGEFENLDERDLLTGQLAIEF